MLHAVLHNFFRGNEKKIAGNGGYGEKLESGNIGNDGTIGGLFRVKGR